VASTALMPRRAATIPTSSTGRPVVTVVYRWLPYYRIPFYEAFRKELDQRGVTLRLIYGQPTAEEATKQDTGSISWGHAIESRVIAVGARSLLWQPCASLVKGSDLVIVEQASKLLLNYVLLARQWLGGPKVALWGHGRNFQQHGASRLGEAVKRVVSRWPHWWFAYTEGSAEIVRGLPYPADRITVVQNAIDTSALRQRRVSVDDEVLSALRSRWGIRSQNVAIYSGGLYAEKRVRFLLDAAHALRRRVPDFELIVLGAGPDQRLVEEAASENTWIHYPGPCFGSEKAAYFGLSRVMLMPGLVGLAVVDAFALEVPLVTVDLPYHSPEIAYLHHGENGLKLPAETDPEGYAGAVADLLADGVRLERLRAGCRSAAKVYTLEAMVDRFADGVVEALSR
jgi:glycosyltransferase involved in cell wall biosynthesis